MKYCETLLRLLVLIAIGSNAACVNAENNDALMEEYLPAGELTDEELTTGPKMYASHVRAWLDRAIQAVQGATVRCEYTLTRRWIQGGVPRITELSGSSTCTGSRHCRTDLTGVVYLEADPTNKEPTRVLTVADGSYNWMETEIPIGTKTVSKVKLEGERTSTDGDGGKSVACGIDYLVEDSDFLKYAIVRSVNGRIILDGQLPIGRSARVVLDEQTHRPVEIQSRFGSEWHHVIIESWSFPEDVDPHLFSYTPAEGVPVIVIPYDAVDLSDPRIRSEGIHD